MDISIQVENGQATLTVRDYGRGITSEQLETISGGFESGVGLMGMRERVNELGGTLAVLLEKPGTSVRVTLPIAEQQTHTTQAMKRSGERRSVA